MSLKLRNVVPLEVDKNVYMTEDVPTGNQH